jgi:hypothetical protein
MLPPHGTRVGASIVERGATLAAPRLVVDMAKLGLTILTLHASWGCPHAKYKIVFWASFEMTRGALD